MRTYDRVLRLSLIGLAIGLSPAASFDGTRAPDTVAVPLPGAQTRSLPPAPLATPPRLAPSPFEAFRSGTQALRDGRTEQAVTALEYAAEQGVSAAQWKLGRMYADGDGVDKNELRAFEFFRALTSANADPVPGTPQARFVANAFVTLGHFYLQGIPNTYVKPDQQRARDMYQYAASYFADPDAQYNLGRLYLDGKATPKDPVQAARWFGLAARKGHRGAQALLGSMLFKGEDVARQAAMGLFWLTVAKDGAGPEDRWISEVYASASAQASENERALAYRYLENWLKNRRD